MQSNDYYLHTSPEFPMKRLLAAGSGSIFQISKVFRQGESGKKHNPEFTLLEWYREGWDDKQLMTEVNQLLRCLLLPHIDLAATQFISYAEAFQQALGINPHTVSKNDLRLCAEKAGLGNVLDADEQRDRFLELLFSHIIEPTLGKEHNDSDEHTTACICFLYHYPASQASLARTAYHNDQLVAERFEVFINGMELANGFHELNDAKEQRQRFAMDNQIRKTMQLDEVPLDERFLDALTYLPDCAGVAIGIERLLMVMSQADHINDVIAFPFDMA